MKNFDIIKNNELVELLDDLDLEELFEQGDIIEEFQVENKNKIDVNSNGYDPELKIY